MRNVLLACAGLVATVLVACGGAPSGDDTSSSDPNAMGATPPSENLAGANTSTGSAGAPSTDQKLAPALVTTERLGASDPAASASGGTSSSSGGTSSSSGGSSSGGPVDPNAGAGPKPTAVCSVTKDSAGFFTRGSGSSSYVAYVPASYNPSTPMRLIVGVHGCGDSAYNFATWGVNPYETRATQTHIGISIGGQDGNCWTAADDAKVLAAVADISSCFWVHQKKIVLAGYSSGGELTYRLGMAQASHFAGLLIEDSALYESGVNETTALAGAAWKLNIAHRTHTSDPVYPLAQVQADWAKETAAGFPLKTSQTAGDHNGTSTDWATWLIPASATWARP